MRLLTLVGLMGSGKTTLGALLAARWRWEAVDLDDEIAGSAGLSVPEIFARGGEATFRELERAALAETLERSRCVLATGGGAPCQPGAMELIAAAGPSIWLDGPVEVLAERLSREGGRPLLAGLDPDTTARELTRLRRARAPFYSRASLTIDVSERSPEELADAIEQALDEKGWHR